MPDSPSIPTLGAPPPVPESLAEAIALERFGLRGVARSLGSHQDRNFLLTLDGEPPLLLKFSHPATSVDELVAQNAAMDYLATRGTSIRMPRAIPALDGDRVATVAVGGVEISVRVLEFVAGEPLSGGRYLAQDSVRAIGALAATIDVALGELSAPALERRHDWDLRRAPEMLEALLPSVRDEGLRARLAAAARGAQVVVDALAPELPRQLIHGDLTDDNVVALTHAAGVPDGVIDFGDLNFSWTIGELAVTVASLLHHTGASVASAMAAVAAYHSIRPLARAEAEALWALVVVRSTVLVASGHHVASIDADNAYASENLVHERIIFDRATALPLTVATAVVLDGLGFEREPARLPAFQALIPSLPAASVAMLDLSATSPLLDCGRWLDENVEAELASAALSGQGAVCTGYAEARLTRAATHTAAEPKNSILGLELTLAVPHMVVAPWSGTVAVSEDRLELRGQGVRLTMRGVGATVADGSEVEPGEPLGSVIDGASLSVSIDGVDVPWAVEPSLVRAWDAASIDPTALILGDVPPSPTDQRLAERRARSLAGAQEHYYVEPPVMVRGWKQHLIDEHGRVYLDGLNNVTAIGHAHPRLVDAVARQWSLINTNSRFQYPSIVDFAERLSGLLPPGLDSVFFVNSGSEAVDLALRIAQSWTGRRDVLAVREAYHGWTGLSDAVSTSVADNPQALDTRPPWVHTVEAPNGYRGRYRGEEASRYADDAVLAIHALADAGTPVGAVIAEAYYGNAGGMPLPDGYLASVYAAVRASGGLCVADEVQVGYGRLGEWFWGFEQQSVVPDVVTVAKAMGNGHPLGAVITSAEIAEHYRSSGYFFSSAGGSPVSSVVGMTVLDVMRDEQLQHNARETGAYLKRRLQELVGRHPLVGAVHGHGMYLGLELVRDRDTLEPATQETLAICERLRERGVIMQPTSDRQCVLKIKPPLCFTRESADFFVDTLDEVLGSGW